MALCLDPPNTTFKERKAVWTKQTGRQVRLPKGGCESQKGQYRTFLQSSSDRDPRPRYQGEAGACRYRCEPADGRAAEVGEGLTNAYPDLGALLPYKHRLDRYSLGCVPRNTMALLRAGHASGPPQALK